MKGMQRAAAAIRFFLFEAQDLKVLAVGVVLKNLPARGKVWWAEAAPGPRASCEVRASPVSFERLAESQGDRCSRSCRTHIAKVVAAGSTGESRPAQAV